MAGRFAGNSIVETVTSAPARDMKLQQFAVVHLINMVAAQNQHVFRTFTLDGVDVLINRIRRSLIPLFRCAELRRNREDELAAIVGKNVPAQTDMTIE